MADLRPIDDRFAVAPQIAPEDMPAIAAAGYTTVVNNRPDDEQPGQPRGTLIAEAAEAAGLAYHAIPIFHAGMAIPQVEAMAEVLEQAPGPVLAFCRSGTRSANLWALARASTGAAPDGLISDAAGAGYDLAPLRSLLEQLAERA